VPDRIALGSDERRLDRRSFTEAETGGATVRPGKPSAEVAHTSRITSAVVRRLDDHRPGPCFGDVIRNEGLYTWGRDLTAASRHPEAMDYLIGCELKLLAAGRDAGARA
jgi:methylthioribulose-1-phosphate dehydratase